MLNSQRIKNLREDPRTMATNWLVFFKTNGWSRGIELRHWFRSTCAKVCCNCKIHMLQVMVACSNADSMNRFWLLFVFPLLAFIKSKRKNKDQERERERERERSSCTSFLSFFISLLKRERNFSLKQEERREEEFLPEEKRKRRKGGDNLKLVVKILIISRHRVCFTPRIISYVILGIKWQRKIPRWVSR